ncbi:MAG: PEGA domain-containing protein [Spirochaetes bacterium]|nr:PEGA domain-containing protein [Spirochaetota bacterium]
MFLKKAQYLFVFIFLSHNLFAFSLGNNEALSNIKKIELLDKGYRTIAVIPFQNLTTKDEYSYIGRTIQKFLSNDLKAIKKLTITTQDYLIPNEFQTNRSLLYAYGTNFIRDVVILDADMIYDSYIRSPDPEDPEHFAKDIKTDYIISGKYSFNSGSVHELSVSYTVYNTIQRNFIHKNSIKIHEKDLDQGIKKISTDLVQYFNPSETGYLKMVTDLSNYEFYIDSKLIHDKMNYYQLSTGTHEIKFQSVDHPSGQQTNITIVKDRTNRVEFSRINFTKNKAVLKVSSEPTDATVFLNVRSLGKTPLVFTNLEPGNYRLQIFKTNHNTYYKNINLFTGTNHFRVNLEKIRSKEYYEKRHKRNKLIMYTTLASGTLFLTSTYLFYINGTIEYDRYDNTYDRNHLDKGNIFMTVSFISALAGLGSYTLSLIYFFKVINYDDVNIGYNDKKLKFNLAERSDNHYLYMQYRF